MYLICKCCSPPRYYESPVLLSVCDHIVCRDTVVQFGDTYVCPLCNSISDQLDTESYRVLVIVNQIESKYICKLHNQDICQICWICNTHACYLCRLCKHEDYFNYPDDRNDLFNSIKVLNIIDENIKKFMQDNTIKIQDNIDLLEQEIRNNNQIITRLRELKQYIKNSLAHHYLQSLETQFSILENRLSSSINQLTETKQNITNYLDNFNTKKSATESLVQVLDWFKEKNRLCSYIIYSLTIKEFDIIDQLLNSYYNSQQHSLTPPLTPTYQQQFIDTLNECIDIKKSIDFRPLLCYPIVNSYRFFNLPKYPIVDPLDNSQLDLFINSKRKNNNNENDDNNSDNNIDNVFVIRYKHYHSTRLFSFILESKFQFNYLFFVEYLHDYKNILIKLDKNFSPSAIVDDRQLIDIFNSNIRNLTSVLIVYHRQFYDTYKYEIQYKNSNIKTIIITPDSDFKAEHPNVNISGEYYLERISNGGLELLFNNLTDSIVSKDDIFYKPLMYCITQVTLKSMRDFAKHIRNKTTTPNEIIYGILSPNAGTGVMTPSTIKPEIIIFKFPVDETLWSLQVDYLNSQTKQNNEWVPITIMKEPKQCTDPYQLNSFFRVLIVVVIVV